MLSSVVSRIPEFRMSPLVVAYNPVSYCVHTTVVLVKYPSIEDAESFELAHIVWWFAAYGELGAGIGLLVAGLLATWNSFKDYGDLLTRFCGITICSIMTGVIWVGEPASFWDVILYDNFHVLLWVGGLFFALRGNRT